MPEKCSFAAGWNMPGYSPDEPWTHFASKEEAESFLLEEVERMLDEDENLEEAVTIESVDGFEYGGYRFSIIPLDPDICPDECDEYCPCQDED